VATKPLAGNEEQGIQKHSNFRRREQWTTHCTTFDTTYTCPSKVLPVQRTGGRVAG